jgi:localization factor PodJL
MSQHGTAKAGHGGTAGSGGDGGTARDDPAAEAGRVGVAGTGPEGEAGTASAFGDGQSEAEAQLYAYMDLMTNSKPASGFPPLDELNARLNEEPYRDSLLFPRADGDFSRADDDFLFGPSQDEAWPELRTVPLGEPHRGLEWFDHRFSELKELLAKKDEGTREIEQIKSSLGEILVRLEKISADMPDGTTLASVETKLTAVSGSLDAALEQSATDASRISRAAEEILAASARMQEAPIRFETAARHTLEGLGQTVAATASHAAVMAANQVSINQSPAAGLGPVERLEAELHALNLQSRESGERTAAGLDRVNNTLRDFLDRDPAAGRGNSSAPPPRKRTGLHVPISGNSAIYKPGNTGFGAAPASEPRLDTIQLRDPPPSDPNLFEAFREADRRHGRKKAADKPEPRSGLAGAQPAFAGASAFLEDEKNVPLGGIAAVAFILLLVSAALFYLHTKGRMDGIHMSAMPAVAERLVQVPQPVRTVTAPKVRVRQNSPALLTAADDNHGSEAAAATEDLETLEAAARHGDRDAQFRIGMRFLNDSALDGGPAAAARWFAKAASQGHNEAQFMLASMYERGAGVEKDEARATALYREAASAGHVRAMHNLGAMLLKNASAQSYREAAAWFEQAAARGFPDSQYNLALLYEHGLGIEQDLQRAYQWYVQAAKAGVKEAAAQAERLRRTLPSARNETGGGQAIQAGSWRPVLEDTKKSVSLGGTAKG